MSRYAESYALSFETHWNWVEDSTFSKSFNWWRYLLFLVTPVCPFYTVSSDQRYPHLQVQLISVRVLWHKSKFQEFHATQNLMLFHLYWIEFEYGTVFSQNRSSSGGTVFFSGDASLPFLWVLWIEASVYLHLQVQLITVSVLWHLPTIRECRVSENLMLFYLYRHP